MKRRPGPPMTEAAQAAIFTPPRAAARRGPVRPVDSARRPDGLYRDRPERALQRPRRIQPRAGAADPAPARLDRRSLRPADGGQPQRSSASISSPTSSKIRSGRSRRSPGSSASTPRPWRASAPSCRAPPGFQPVPVAEDISATSNSPRSRCGCPNCPASRPCAPSPAIIPEGAAVGHLLGYVGTPSREDYERQGRDPLLLTPGFKIGKEGPGEGQGSGPARHAGPRPGSRSRRAAGWCASSRTLPDIGGRVLHTTIDAGLQSFAARRLGEQSGSCVLLDCHSGDILCMASMPAYDPNTFSDGISRSEWEMMARGRAPSADQQDAERALSARLDLQAGGGDGGAGGRRSTPTRR